MALGRLFNACHQMDTSTLGELIPGMDVASSDEDYAFS